MNVFEPPTSFYVLAGIIEGTIKHELESLFEENSKEDQIWSNYNTFYEFLANISEHLNDYLDLEETIALGSIIQNLHYQELKKLFEEYGISFVLKLGDVRVKAQDIVIEIPNAGELKLNWLDVTDALDQYVVYKSKELILPFTFEIPIRGYYMEDYYFSSEPNPGFGVLFETLIYIDNESLKEGGLSMRKMEREVNKLLHHIAIELLTQLQNENFSVLLRSLATVDIE